MSHRPRPPPGMEEDHGHGGHLLLAHPHWHHSVGAPCGQTNASQHHAHVCTDRTQTLLQLPHTLPNTRPGGEDTHTYMQTHTDTVSANSLLRARGSAFQPLKLPLKSEGGQMETLNNEMKLPRMPHELTPQSQKLGDDR